MDMLNPVTLLAMAPSGATLILRDRRERLWLYPPVGAGKPRVIDSETAEQAIGRHDLERIDQDFASWAELDEFRQQRVRKTSPRTIVDVQSLDLEDVERLLTVAERWLADEEGERACQLALRLLRVPAVLGDPATHERLVGLLESLHEPTLDLHSEPRTELQMAAYARFELARAA